jgi:hypothetical protein
VHPSKGRIVDHICGDSEVARIFKEALNDGRDGLIFHENLVHLLDLKASRRSRVKYHIVIDLNVDGIRVFGD